MPKQSASARLLEMIEEGLINRDVLINSCLNYMSERDIQDMAECEGFFSDDEEEV